MMAHRQSELLTHRVYKRLFALNKSWSEVHVYTLDHNVNRNVDYPQKSLQFYINLKMLYHFFSPNRTLTFSSLLHVVKKKKKNNNYLKE